jgi:hypothetical protein
LHDRSRMPMLGNVDQDHGGELQERADVRARSPGPQATLSAATGVGAAGLAGALGNAGFSRLLARAREGEGILPSGVVHPEVEAAIAAAGPSGQRLRSDVAETAGSALGDSFADVRIHADDHAAALSRAVSARAFTVGRDIFFGSGEYRPETADGRALLTHELAHVVQQRGAPSSGPLQVSHPGDPLELEADAASRGV